MRRHAASIENDPEENPPLLASLLPGEVSERTYPCPHTTRPTVIPLRFPYPALRQTLGRVPTLQQLASIAGNINGNNLSGSHILIFFLLFL